MNTPAHITPFTRAALFIGSLLAVSLTGAALWGTDGGLATAFVGAWAIPVGYGVRQAAR